jgi:hypothetical protein
MVVCKRAIQFSGRHLPVRVHLLGIFTDGDDALSVYLDDALGAFCADENACHPHGIAFGGDARGFYFTALVIRN